MDSWTIDHVSLLMSDEKKPGDELSRDKYAWRKLTQDKIYQDSNNDANGTKKYKENLISRVK